MKIYISADLEGICGIVHWDSVSDAGFDYPRARKLMTEEVNAAIAGALRAGADQVIVNDSHDTMTNILIEDLNPQAKLITGYPKMGSMMEGLDHTFDGVILIGYHSRIGTPGVLNHTYSSKTVYNLRINGIDVGELGINSYIAGHFGVPVLMVSGDNLVAKEAQELIPGIKTAIVKETIGRHSAFCMHPERARDLIEQTAYCALTEMGSAEPVTTPKPVQMEVTLMNSAMADEAQIMPGITRTGANSLLYTAPDIIVAYRALRTITALARPF